MRLTEDEILDLREAEARAGMSHCVRNAALAGGRAADVRAWARLYPWPTVGASAAVGLLGGLAATLLLRRPAEKPIPEGAAADEGAPARRRRRGRRRGGLRRTAAFARRYLPKAFRLATLAAAQASAARAAAAARAQEEALAEAEPEFAAARERAD